MLFCYTRIYKRTAKYAKWFNSVYSQILTLLTLLLFDFPLLHSHAQQDGCQATPQKGNLLGVGQSKAAAGQQNNGI